MIMTIKLRNTIWTAQWRSEWFYAKGNLQNILELLIIYYKLYDVCLISVSVCSRKQMAYWMNATLFVLICLAVLVSSSPAEEHAGDHQANFATAALFMLLLTVLPAENVAFWVVLLLWEAGVNTNVTA